MQFTIMMRLEVRPIPCISPYYFTLSLCFTLVIIATNQSNPSLDYITINFGKLNGTKPTSLGFDTLT
jgi:hypothetical protein